MELFWNNAFYEIAVILGLAALCGGLGLLLRQPLLIAFLIVGIIVGPSALHLVDGFERIEVLAHIGIALLLFVVGLRLDLHLIRTLGPVALATGLGQVVFTAGFGFLIAIGLGMAIVPALYVAVALTFSSTIIIVKLLSDKAEIDSLHGRIAIGFLIVQDVVAIAAMIVLVALGDADGEHAGYRILYLLVTGLAFIAFVAASMRWIFPVLLQRIAKQQEYLVLFAVAWAVMLSAAADMLGFSKEVGAFLAGVSLASTSYREAIGARLTSLRDFLLLFFFIVLGAGLEFGTLTAQIPQALLFSAFVLVGNPIIVMAIMGVMGYHRRTSFLAGLTVAQVSEFSLILAALGRDLGHLDEQDLGLVTIVGILTICASTYMILFSDTLYRWLDPALRIFERGNPYHELGEIDDQSGRHYDVILIGLGTYGSAVAKHLRERRKQVLGIDFDPQIIRRWQDVEEDVFYGDAADPELLQQIPIDRCRWIVSTLRNRGVNLRLLQALRERGFKGRVAVAVRDETDVRSLNEAGADAILRPYADAAEQAADALTETAGILHIDLDWPVSLRELRLPTGAACAGSALRELPLYIDMGVSVLAVSRAGRLEMEPNADFRLFPGDRIVLMGTDVDLRRAEAYLIERETVPSNEQGVPEFAIAEAVVSPDSPAVGRSLVELDLRRQRSVNVIGIVRGTKRILSPPASEMICGGDRLIIIGRRSVAEELRRTGTL